jgi:hypothetical protein
MCVASFSRDDVRRVLIWALLGYLLPEQQWDHDRDGAWRGYKGRSIHKKILDPVLCFTYVQ